MRQAIELPTRNDNHVRETASYKVLENCIPSEWMIRSFTERDYGVDCYIELVDDKKRLTGEVAFIQMKSTDKIDWRKSDNGFKFYKVERSTTNYLNSFKIPTYLFLVDLSNKSLYFLSVKEYIKEHYEEYMSSAKSFPYEFFKDKDLYSIDAFKKSFQRSNLYDQFRNELQYFISNIRSNVDFIREHNNRDCFMQIEQEDMMFFEAMHRNISFLQEYFGVTRKLTTLDVLEKRGIQKYGDDYEQTLFEGVLTDMYDELKVSILETVDRIIDFITVKERHYWLHEKNYIFNYFFNLDKTRLFY